MANKSTLTIGFSTCPNDTFIFDALVNGRINTGNLTFEPVLADVEELNQMAFDNKLDITKLSFNAFGHISDKYKLLNSGSALGHNCGPLVISREKITDPEKQLLQMKIAIPGVYTTANLLFGLAYPSAKNKIPMFFADIENAVLSGKADAGVIIHESRFTYQQKGLVKVLDLGEFWFNLTAQPIPLGGIAIKRSLPNDVQVQVDQLVRKSVEYAFAHPEASIDYIKLHAQEMAHDVVQQHIKLYVNQHSIDLGEEGRKAIQYLLTTAAEKGILPKVEEDLFVKIPHPSHNF